MSLALGIIHGRRKGAGYDLLRGALYVLSQAYGAGLTVYLFAERVGLRRRVALPVPTISIGNLTSGGTGKTPMTEMLVRRLAADGLRPVILSRGHGGSIKKGVGQVSDSHGRILLSARECGDESALLARLLPGSPVFVGRDRRESARVALELERPGVIVLDDGLQYWQLARSLDIALVDARRPFDNGYLLPRGALREPKRHLRRAGVIVITRSDMIEPRELGALRAELQKLARASDIFTARHVFGGLRPLNHAAQSVLPARPLAVCAIAQPGQFFEMLRGSGLNLDASRALALEDHADFDKASIKRIRYAAKSSGADAVVVTEKDAVKLNAECFDLPVYAAPLRIEMDEMDEFYAAVLRRSGLRRLLAPESIGEEDKL